MDVEAAVRRLTDTPVAVKIDNSLDCLGRSTMTTTGHMVEINLLMHEGLPVSELADTISHEVAHVEHMRSLRPTVEEVALGSFVQYSAMIAKHGWEEIADYEDHFNAALILVMRSKNSHHGPEWKKWARRLGATPRAGA